ncbi:hypothetical protein IT399_02735 [Candidatus Nomurabacteria bacterium]|nr:hypothetical protein [Candidatus Nomurabacteria bacterium]
MIRNTIAGIWENCLINDGYFNFHPTSGNIEFASCGVSKKGKNRKIFEIAKNKIKQFLKANGLEIKN